MNITRLLELTIPVGIAVNSALIVAHYLLTGEARLYHPGDQFPEIIGVDVSGTRRVVSDAPCYVMRITQDDCPYCRADQPAYATFIEHAQGGAACAVVEVSPKAGTMALHPREGITQLELVQMELGQAMWPYVTPQTLLLDGDRKVIWSRIGTFDNLSMANALEILSNVGQ